MCRALVVVRRRPRTHNFDAWLMPAFYSRISERATSAVEHDFLSIKKLSFLCLLSFDLFFERKHVQRHRSRLTLNVYLPDGILTKRRRNHKFLYVSRSSTRPSDGGSNNYSETIIRCVLVGCSRRSIPSRTSLLCSLSLGSNQLLSWNFNRVQVQWYGARSFGN